MSIGNDEPRCGCVGCDLEQMGRQVHGQINELRGMIDSRDKRLNEVYKISGNMVETPAEIRDVPFPDRYPGGKY